MSHACLHEHALVQAQLAGESTPEFTAHIRECESCRQAVAIAGRLRRSLPETLRPVLPPRVLWLRARLNRRRTSHEAAMLPVTILELVGPVMLIAALLAWFIGARLNRAASSTSEVLTGTGETYLVVVATLTAVMLAVSVGSLWSWRRGKLETTE